MGDRSETEPVCQSSLDPNCCGSAAEKSCYQPVTVSLLLEADVRRIEGRVKGAFVTRRRMLPFDPNGGDPRAERTARRRHLTRLGPGAGAGPTRTAHRGWRIEHLTHRTMPADDTAPLDLHAGDEDLIIAQILAIALERRAIADGTSWSGRGPVHPLAAEARSARMDADRLFWERLRRARGGYVEDKG